MVKKQILFLCKELYEANDLYEENVFSQFDFCNCCSFYISDQKSLGQNTSMVGCLESFKSLFYKFCLYVCLKELLYAHVSIRDRVSKHIIYITMYEYS